MSYFFVLTTILITREFEIKKKICDLCFRLFIVANVAEMLLANARKCAHRSWFLSYEKAAHCRTLAQIKLPSPP
jgi:hypothetical protein